MQDWCLYTDDRISLRLPRQLRKSRSGLLFKGRLTRSDPKSETWVVVEPNVSADVVESQRLAMRKPLVSGESNGTYYEYRHCGESRTRRGGFEQKVSFTNPGGPGHGWNITFPCGDKWVMIRIDNMAGGLTWDQMEAVGSEIIRSFQLHEAGAGPVAEPPDPIRATQDEGSVNGSTDASEGEIEWFACDGGPHLVLPRFLRRRWKGVGNLANMLDPNTDYGQACAVPPPVGLIRVSDGQAVVLAGSPPMTGWRHSPGQKGVDLYVLDELKASGPDGLVAAALNALAPDAIVDTGLRLMLKKVGLILMFAGDVSGNAAYGEISITAPPGMYRILKARYQGAEGSLWVFRLVSETEER